jgi:purine-binding chemotaxis protein CheW
MINQSDNSRNSYLSFKVGSEVFAANVKCIRNILEMTKITRVPKSPQYLKGVINLRGNVLPVLDTRTKFGLEETEYTANTCILVMDINIKNETVQLGAIVDSVDAVLEIDDDEIKAAPTIGKSYKSELLNGFTKTGDDFIMIINTDKVFADDDVIDFQNIVDDVM